MLDFFRRQAQSKFFQITIVIIILVFIFWGVGANQGGGRNAIATVNDEPITLQDYQKEYDQMVTALRSQFGGTLPKGLLEATNFKQQVINKLIQATLMRQGGKDVGLYVSNQELQESIQEMEAFKNNGVFDVNWYKQVLTSSRMTVPSFEASMRYDLLYAKIIDHLGRFGQVSANETNALFHYEFNQKNIQYVTLKPVDFRNKVEVDDSKLAAFFADHKDAYKTEPKIKLRYINIPNSGAGIEVSFTDEEINRSYQANINRFRHQEEREVSHILIKSPKDASPEEAAAKRKIIEDILAQAKSGADFAELAKKYSEDSTAVRGGSLGFFSKGRMVKPFEDAAFALQEGAVSDVVQTQFGFHILKLNQIKASGTTPLEEVKDQIIAQLKSQKLKNIVFKKANDTYEAIILSGSLDNYAASDSPAKMTITETDFFSQQEPPKALQSMPPLMGTAFSMKKGELSSIIDTGQGYAIIYVADRLEPAPQELADIHDQVQNDYIKEESSAMAKAGAEEFLKKLKEGADFVKEAEAMKLNIATTGFVSRDKLAGTSLAPQILQDHFNLSAENRFSDKIVPDNGNFLVLAFKDSKEPAAELLESKEPELNRQIAKTKAETLLVAWVGYLREKADITINQEML